MDGMTQRVFQRHMAMAAWLALLLAICMPVASRLRMPSAAADAAMAGMCMPDHSAPDAGVPLDACGYCSLFAHVPYVAMVVAGMALLPALPVPAPVRMPYARALQHADAWSYPRGPPQR